MVRNLDTALIRAFVTVAGAGSMTAAAEALHLTQAAVSQQIKRLEDGFGAPLFDRDRKGLALTNAGERLHARAKRLLTLNDEIWAEMTTAPFDGTVRLGVPSDLVETYLPPILKAYARLHPRVDITLTCLSSPDLLAALAADRLDVALAEEPVGRTRGEGLLTDRLVWVGAKGGEAFRRRPLPVSLYCDTCAFRPAILDVMKASGLAWRSVTEADGAAMMNATVQTDLAVSALLASTVGSGFEVLPASCGLPPLPSFTVNLHLPRTGATPAAAALAATIRDGFLFRQRQAA
ncbi:LysR family transcriptional regulator [Lichenihabitans sp. Uapishka_5]|uniref:LysR family transcriptional regulator n=1 Tax=Lichenihabitans sp. Uapishka_5 TaxID=3037302 RepID=UPI0029E7D3CD|nr:LysR family transcriptional regulator [Lichenihabitans sp. Uapishka_5]MDX7953516.1 LysR family transcriptional regulator [Lichenihabitans sp. Uapishka_5]